MEQSVLSSGAVSRSELSVSSEGSQGSPAESSRPPVREAAWLDLGLVEYERCHRLQLRLHAARVTSAVPDTAIVLEHLPCLTLGRFCQGEHVLAKPEELSAAGIRLHHTERGGDVTYHGPGQLVLYTIFDLAGYGKDVHAHARRLEQVLIDALATFGVEAVRRPEYPGVWTEQGKIGAIGFAVKRWVTLHGVSLNVSPDLSHFGFIVPCGLHGERVTSLKEILGGEVEMELVKREVKRSFAKVFGVRLIDWDRKSLEEELGRTLLKSGFCGET